LVESNHPAVLQSGSWTISNSDVASGGSYLYSSGSFDDSLSLTFTGTQLSIIYVKHPALGVFAVEIDQVVIQTVNSVAAESVFGTQAVITGLADGLHTLKIYPVVGVVAIDAFSVEGFVDAPVPPPTSTPVPTQEVLPTNEPTATDIPTSTPEPPTATEPPTETPVPTNMPTEVPTETPVPSDTPLPTEAPTDLPPGTSIPSDTPELIVPPTDIPTQTPMPTQVPIELTPEVTEEPAS
jgi:hypothetical protein